MVYFIFVVLYEVIHLVDTSLYATSTGNIGLDCVVNLQAQGPHDADAVPVPLAFFGAPALLQSWSVESVPLGLQSPQNSFAGRL